MRREDYPCRFRSADKQASNFQRNYYRLVATELIILVLISIIVSLLTSPWAFFGVKETYILMGVSVLVIVVFLVRVFRKKSNLDTLWYKSRSLAETLKSITWQYMMRAGPYLEGQEEASERFLKDLRSISESQGEVLSRLEPVQGAQDQLTAKMVEIRKLDLEKRYNIYQSERVNEQMSWYRSRIRSFNDSQTKWSKGTWLAEFIVLVLAIISIKFGENIFGFVPFLIVIVTGISSWTRAKRYQALSESYNLTQQELSEIGSKGKPQNQEEFIEYVREIEITISKEHTMWLARRGNLAIRGYYRTQYNTYV